MADTSRMPEREPDGGDAPDDGDVARRKQERPAGFRLQVFTPPAFDEGPLWGTQPDAKVSEPEPGVQVVQPARSLRARQMVLAGTLAALGGLLVTAGMLVSKLHEGSPNGSSAAALSASAALMRDAGAAGRAEPGDAGASAVAEPLEDADAGGEPETAPSTTGLASVAPPARMAPPGPAVEASAGPRDASAPAAPKDAGPGKKLILTDAPF